MIMAQEDQNQRQYRSSNSTFVVVGGGGIANNHNITSSNNNNNTKSSSSTKKLKQKKVPQRGLGVAQLEKIRLEEQQKKEAAATVRFSPPSATAATTASASASASPTITSTTSPTCSSYPALPIPNHTQTQIPVLNPNHTQIPIHNYNPTQIQNQNHNHHSPALIPLPPPLQTGASPSSLFRLPPGLSTTDIDLYSLGCVQLPSRANGDTGTSGAGAMDFTWALPISSTTPATAIMASHGNVPKLWNCEYNGALEGENFNLRLDHLLALQAQNLPYECCIPNRPLSLVIQRPQQCQHPPSPMVTVSAMNSASPALNYQAEPPSNQSYCGNYNTPTWTEEEKMVGMKRAYPFSLENQPGPSFQSKLSAIIHSITNRSSDESASCGNGSSLVFESINPNREEGPSCSAPMAERAENNPVKATKANGVSHGDFLTLAPPALPSSKIKRPTPLAVSHPSYDNLEFSAFEALPYHQGHNPKFQPDQGLAIQPPPPFYSFLRPVQSQTVDAMENMYNAKGDGEEGGVDLSLKL